MQTKIHSRYASTPRIAEAETILRTCVHCGFCNATCPTYLELGDERDGPRGRIYLLKALFENGSAGTGTQTHLDRCLTCRNCETTCPSGVEFGRLLDIGRGVLERQVPRTWRDRAKRWLVKRIVPYRGRFGVLLVLARSAAPLLPARLRAKVPPRRPVPPRPAAGHPRVMLALAGCAQAAATPQTNAAAARVLDRLGVALHEAPAAGCCGALSFHLGDHREGLDFARRNVDAWWPAIERGAETVVVTASGCGEMVKQYGHLLQDDADYAAKAARVSALARDLAEVLDAEDLTGLAAAGRAGKVAVHCPCTLQHGQRLPGIVASILSRCGMTLAATRDAHLCCGSAGSYSLLQPALSGKLLDNKLAALSVDAPALIATANVGCQLHLQSKAAVPVVHWIELLDR
jgi:glycolate oxidase iron-sulfur subunit